MDNENRTKQIFGSIYLVVGVVLIIAIMGLVVGSFFNASIFQDVTNNDTVTNEVLSAVDNVTTTDFAILTTYPGATCTLGTVTNTTDGVVISSGNYTQPDTCQILAEVDSTFIGVNWNVSYAWTNTDSPLGGVNITILTAGFSAFTVGIIAFLGIIGIIIGIVWLISYLKPLFSKDEGLQSFGGS